MIKNILVTGGNGFIGKNINNYFFSKYNIFSPSSSKLNLLDEKSVNKYFSNNSFDYIFHCAGVGVSRGYKQNGVVENNLKMFNNLLKSYSKEDTKLVLFGSGAEYNKEYSLEKIHETEFGISVPQDSYGYSKYVISNEVRNLDDVVVLRLFGVYGKYEDWAYRFISNAIVRNCFRLPIVINQNVFFDYLYVNDLIKILEKILRRFPKYKHINITPDETTDLVSIANIVNEIGDHQSEIEILNHGLSNAYTGDNRRLKEEYPEVEFTSMYNGIKDLNKYYRDNLTKIDEKRLLIDPLSK